MTPRVRLCGRVLGSVLGALDRFNARHPWSHNDRLHGWVLRRLPDGRRAALDVGCGSGSLVVRLADRFERVDGVDPDAVSAAWTARRLSAHQGVRVRALPFERVLPADGPDGYDAITMVAVLHHLDLVPALEHARRLLAPDGRLLVVGLARPGSVRDVAVDLVSVVLNPLVGLAKHPRAVRPVPGRGHGGFDDDTPPPTVVRAAELTVADVARRAERVLAGARVRRRLFFRYTLEWTAPA
ncbi:class I SAM-dependent methyltransferase [Luteimicrobium subarcticum]|uniref:Methyltransferase family protein n=1 Tax=Luteimicrobium subarcticum TaxID=620910 RepID=A0A2M8WU51_9MICO|nr:class I SAM-dependent methyltransferase [Luteimicrobium subarcticum]PJI94419.1 methyltransferase family protein [Luteimicrobium subarcticum]